MFLSANLITTLSFKDDVRTFIYGGTKEEIFTELANNNKTLVLKAKKKGIETNLIVVTSKNRYYFKVMESDKIPHQFVEVEDDDVEDEVTVGVANEDGRGDTGVVEEGS